MTTPKGKNMACEICSIHHRYSYPDGSDFDGHEWSPIACSNTVYYLRNTIRHTCPTCNGAGLIVKGIGATSDMGEEAVTE